MNATATLDTQPWYRQFWPWFLIFLPASVVVAGIYTLVIANEHADDLVVDDYYKEGLAINREIRRQQAADQLGLSVVVSSEGRQLDVRFTGDISAPQLLLHLSHPLEASRDLKVPLKQIGPGFYRVMLPLALEGRWHWTIDTGDGSPWRLDGNQHF